MANKLTERQRLNGMLNSAFGFETSGYEQPTVELNPDSVVAKYYALSDAVLDGESNFKPPGFSQQLHRWRNGDALAYLLGCARNSQDSATIALKTLIDHLYYYHRQTP